MTMQCVYCPFLKFSLCGVLNIGLFSLIAYMICCPVFVSLLFYHCAEEITSHVISMYCWWIWLLTVNGEYMNWTYIAHFYLHSHTHSHTNGGRVATQGVAISSNLGFNVLLKDMSTHGQEEPGIEPPTLCGLLLLFFFKMI